MKYRSIAAPLLLPIITFGFYALVWSVSTKNEMNWSGTAIPTAWLLIVPIANIIWLWKYSAGVEVFTKKGVGRHAAFWLMFLVGSIGSAVVQNKFNKTIDGFRVGVPAAV
ncbi:DUF4234 domain-containing protein [Arthrobacter sp. ISL-69]|uniref:DUF4234 domain-containing protein n=1 Tax=Arthrobacter sp. ISL-69 TaxID=2819113 RepID=UPI001BEC3B86|nr:DUF4234 domain-containing protein [Arthrobacter sp. ISL-69]MBT2538973.1 DUF4234 domain-containing protein [Arthrobacter sp. ISL-69]